MAKKMEEGEHHLHICNIVVVGEVGFKHKLVDKDIIHLFKKGWRIINGELGCGSTILGKKFEEKKGANLFPNGKVVIYGCLNQVKANEIFAKILEDVKKIKDGGK